VEKETQRERATAIVEGVYGVCKVNNLLMIKNIIKSRPEKSSTRLARDFPPKTKFPPRDEMKVKKEG